MTLDLTVLPTFERYSTECPGNTMSLYTFCTQCGTSSTSLCQGCDTHVALQMIPIMIQAVSADLLGCLSGLELLAVVCTSRGAAPC